MTDDERLARVLGMGDADETRARLEAAYASSESAGELADAIVRHSWGHPEDNDLLWYVDDLFSKRAEQVAANGQPAPIGLMGWEEKVSPLRDV